MIYFTCLILLFLGVYCILVKKNILKIIIGLFLIEYSINLFFVALGYRYGGRAPIIGTDPQWFYVDPLPQMIVLASIFIGLSMLLLVSSIAMRLYEEYGTLDIREIRKLKG